LSSSAATSTRLLRVLLLGALVFVALLVRAERAEAHCFAGPCYWISVEIYGTGSVESTVSDNLQKIVCPASGAFRCTTDDWFNWADFGNQGIIRLTPTATGSNVDFKGWFSDPPGHACLHILAGGVCELRNADFGAEGTEGWCMVAKFGPVDGGPSPTRTAGDCNQIPQQPVGRPVVVKKSGTGSGTVTGPDAFSCNTTCSQKSKSYPEGTFISFFVSAASGSHFVGWSGNMGCSGTAACGFSVPCGSPDPEVCSNPTGTLPSVTATFALNNPPGPRTIYYNTVLLTKPAKVTRSRRASFGWGAKLDGVYKSNFKSQCRLGSKPWGTCRPGKTYTKLKPGYHTFRVRVAQTNTSRWDKTPASYTWRIKR